jgi:hypothetical protein
MFARPGYSRPNWWTICPAGLRPVRGLLTRPMQRRRTWRLWNKARRNEKTLWAATPSPCYLIMQGGPLETPEALVLENSEVCEVCVCEVTSWCSINEWRRTPSYCLFMKAAELKYTQGAKKTNTTLAFRYRGGPTTERKLLIGGRIIVCELWR